MAKFSINATNLKRLQKAIEEYQGNVEPVINDVLHNEAYPLFEDMVRQLMPVSGRSFKGKKPPAKRSKSIQKKTGNLRVGLTPTSSYNYLYFPDDGQNVRNSARRRAGNQQFFLRGVQHHEDEVIERCVESLVTNFNETI